MNERIEEGDIVGVNFNGAQTTLCSRARVIHTPCATGDSWIFREDDGTTHAVSEGCTITRLSRKEAIEPKGQDE